MTSSNAASLPRRAFVLSLACAAATILVGRFFGGPHDVGRIIDRHPESLFAMSAFDMSLYQSQTQEPYVSYPCTPRKVHIAQANDVSISTERVDMFVSFSLDRRACERAAPRILYGQGYLVEGTRVASPEDRVSFDFQSDKTTEQKYQSDWIYHVRLSGLEAGLKLYWYQIVVHSDSKGVFDAWVARDRELQTSESPRYAFRTPPHLGSGPTNLALVGDVGQTENSTKTFNHIMAATNILEDPVSMILMCGDLSYSDSDPFRWDSWLDLMEPLLRTTPMSSVPGNHEIEYDTHSHEIFTPYEHLFRNPNRIAPADRKPIGFLRRVMHTKLSGGFIGHYNYGNAFYGFTHGLAHIISLNSYTDCTVASVQYRWLAKELQRVDRRITPWLIVQFHNPLHTSFSAHTGEKNSRSMLHHMEPLFVKYGVNIVLSGHDHAYMRTNHMIGRKVDPTKRGPVHFIIGTGGNRELHGKYIHDVPEDFVAKRDIDEYGFGNLLLSNATHAHFKWVRDGTTISGIQDDTILINQHIHPISLRSRDV